MAEWWSIEVHGEPSAARWKATYSSSLIQSAVSTGAVDWAWHEYRWGVVFQAARQLLDHRPFALEVLRHRVVDAVAAMPRVDLLVHRQPNSAPGLQAPGVGGLPRASQPAQQVHDGWHAAMLSRHTPPPCRQRAIHSSLDRSPADTHGQQHSGRDLHGSPPLQVASPPDLALQAGGRLVEGLDRLAVPGRPMRSLVAGDRERRRASATGRDRRSRAGVREPQLCDDSHAELSPRPDGDSRNAEEQGRPNG
jgi:hypothetical protein